MRCEGRRQYLLWQTAVCALVCALTAFQVHLLLFACFTEGKFAVTALFHPQYLWIGKELEVVNYTEDRADTA